MKTFACWLLLVGVCHAEIISISESDIPLKFFTFGPPPFRVHFNVETPTDHFITAAHIAELFPSDDPQYWTITESNASDYFILWDNTSYWLDRAAGPGSGFGPDGWLRHEYHVKAFELQRIDLELTYLIYNPPFVTYSNRWTIVGEGLRGIPEPSTWMILATLLPFVRRRR